MTEHERFINEYCRNVGDIKIRCDDCKFVEDCVDYGWDGCRKFTPKPSKPMTEQEYLQSCNTEQLAEWIYQLSVMDRIDQPWYFTPIRGSQKIVEWLKQPHKE